MTMTQISLRRKTKEEADAKDEGSNTDKEDADGKDSIVSQVANWVGSLIFLYCPSSTVERGLGIVLNN